MEKDVYNTLVLSGEDDQSHSFGCGKRHLDQLPHFCSTTKSTKLKFEKETKIPKVNSTLETRGEN